MACGLGSLVLCLFCLGDIFCLVFFVCLFFLVVSSAF